MVESSSLRTRWSVALAACAALAASLGACSGVGSDEPERAEGATDSSAVPFVVDPVPEGYQFVAAGEGTQRQTWGDDMSGTDQPFTVLTDGTDRIVVTTFGYEGLEGGFGRGGGSTIDGWRSEGRDLGDDMGVAASSATVDVEVLRDVLDRVVRPDDRRSAPTFEALPPGWSVLGSTAADVVASAYPYVSQRSAAIPGTQRTFGAGWVRTGAEGDDPTELAVVSFPEDLVDPASWIGELRAPVTWSGDATGREVSVDGRDAVFVEIAPLETGLMHLLLTPMADGSVLMVSSVGPALMTEEQLVDVARATRPATPAEWSELVTASWGGPELEADDGEVELVRGRQGDEDWLLQTRHSTNPFAAPGAPPEVRVDECLKLTRGRRACAEMRWNDAMAGFYGNDIARTDSVGFPHPFYIVSTELPGASVMVTTRAGSESTPLVELPDGGSRAAVVFIDDPIGGLGCSAAPLPPEFTDNPEVSYVYVDIVDANDRFLGCASGADPDPA